MGLCQIQCIILDMHHWDMQHWDMYCSCQVPSKIHRETRNTRIILTLLLEASSMGSLRLLMMDAYSVQLWTELGSATSPLTGIHHCAGFRRAAAGPFIIITNGFLLVHTKLDNPGPPEGDTSSTSTPTKKLATFRHSLLGYDSSLR